MNVTPESEVPIIPKATMYQGDSLLPKKNDSFPSFFPVNREITERNKKYTIIHSIIYMEFIDDSKIN